MTEPSTSGIDRFAKYLPDTEDPTLILLKGHLVIEELLHALAAAHCANPESLGKARLTFTQVTYLAQALLQLPPDAPWWEPVLALNKVRDSLVHELEPRAFESNMVALYGLCRSKDAEAPASSKNPATPTEMARHCVMYIMGQMAAINQVAELLRKHYPSGVGVRRVERRNAV